MPTVLGRFELAHPILRVKICISVVYNTSLLVQFGRLSDACTVLDSSGVLDFTPEVIEALEHLHDRLKIFIRYLLWGIR